jgi:hypothetical protein
MGLKSKKPSTAGMEAATEKSIALQREMYEQGREDLQPWYKAGGAGVTRLSELLGIAPFLEEEGAPEGYGSLMEGFDRSKFEEDPGYQFRKEQGQDALERSMAAQGITLGGAGYGEVNPRTATAIQDYSQGLASQEYGQAYNRYNQDQGNVYNRLLGIGGIGQGAASQMAGAGQTYGTNVGNLHTGLAGAQYKQSMADYERGTPFENIMGNMSPLYSMGSGRGQAGQMFMQSAPMVFSDRRLKENVELVGRDGPHEIFEFDYRDGSGRFRGVMAQNVLEIDPEAVTEHSNGFLMVNYDKLGLKMERA